LVTSFLLLASSALAGVQPTTNDLQQLIKNRGIHSGSGFTQAQGDIEAKYGKKAFAPLMKIGESKTAEDSHRYFAIQTAAQLGGVEAESHLKPLLNDSSWMVRSASLNSLMKIRANLDAKEWKKLLKDPALVMRSQAVRAVATAQPDQAADWLIELLQDQNNFRNGRPEWVSFEALKTLPQFTLNEKHRSALKELFKKHKDDKFRKAISPLMKEAP